MIRLTTLAGRVADITGGTDAVGRVKHFIEFGASLYVPWIVEAEVETLRSYLGDLASRMHLPPFMVPDEPQAFPPARQICRGRQRTVS